MTLTNTTRKFGAVTKTFHWLTALLILSALALGIAATQAPYTDGTELARKAWLFSLHKTIGVTAFLVAIMRITWALTQPRPRLLNGNQRLEAIAAETAHWVLYGAMLLVPLTGWMHHAATTGFAPIWWPFGQSLPFVPKSESFASLMGGLHFTFMLVLVATIAAHVGGALKHFFIDKDQTLQRMLPAMRSNALPTTEQPGHVAPFLAALTVWTGAVVIGVWAFSHPTANPKQTPQLAKVASQWQVESGTLDISVRQMGSDIQGGFTDWTAEITFDETAPDGQHGEVRVQVSIPSLELGSVTGQALGPDFLDAGSHGVAVFSADILADDQNYVARGALSLKGATIPVTLPFALTLEGDRAKMSGQVTLDRRDFGIGETMPDETTLGFSVQIHVALTATRGDVAPNLSEAGS